MELCACGLRRRWPQEATAGQRSPLPAERRSVFRDYVGWRHRFIGLGQPGNRVERADAMPGTHGGRSSRAHPSASMLPAQGWAVEGAA